MEKQEFLNRVSEIGTCEDEVRRRELLAQLSEDAGKDYDSIATLTESNTRLTNDNETLRDANMKLFLRVGESKSNAEKLKDQTGASVEEKDKKLKFEDLFDEKGGLK